MNNESLLGLAWAAPAQPEILVKVLLSHGDWDVFEEQTLRFPDNPRGQKKAKLAVDVLPYLSQVLREPDAYDHDAEQLCVLVAERADVPSADELFAMFEPLIRVDLAYDQYALVAAVRVEHRTAQHTAHAVFATTHGGTVRCQLKALTEIPSVPRKLLREFTGNEFAPSTLLEKNEGFLRKVGASFR